MRLVDTHCHLNDAEAFPDVGAVLQEAHEAGVDRLVVVGTDSLSSRRAVEVAEAHDGVYAVVGWHPTSAAGYGTEGHKEVERLLTSPKVVAIGEIGLDFYWDRSTPEEQYRCLEDQLELARESGKPIVLHCRDANDELLAFLEARPPHPCLFHCFSGDSGHAARAVALGAYLGVDGPVTYPKNDALRQTLAGVPRERIVVETDSPYLAPVPYRGKRNRPAWVTLVNRALADVLGITEEECAELTTRNAERYFGI